MPGPPRKPRSPAVSKKVVARIEPAGAGRLVRHAAGFDLTFSGRALVRELDEQIRAGENPRKHDGEP